MPVPAAAPFWYLSVELMSTMPGWTLFATDWTLMLVALVPPGLFWPGVGICCAEELLRPDDVASLWVTATTAPAPTAAATAAVTR
jgi:hypothetical protein